MAADPGDHAQERPQSVQRPGPTLPRLEIEELVLDDAGGGVRLADELGLDRRIHRVAYEHRGRGSSNGDGDQGYHDGAPEDPAAHQQSTR